MASSKTAQSLPLGRESFDVVCVVGTVELSEYGPLAHVTAMELIATHDAEGVYTFPMADGRTQRVTVEFLGGETTETER